MTAEAQLLNRVRATMSGPPPYDWQAQVASGCVSKWQLYWIFAEYFLAIRAANPKPTYGKQ